MYKFFSLGMQAHIKICKSHFVGSSIFASFHLFRCHFVSLSFFFLIFRKKKEIIFLFFRFLKYPCYIVNYFAKINMAVAVDTMVVAKVEVVVLLVVGLAAV